MSRIVVIMFVVCCRGVIALGDEFPYTATVAHHNVTARSGATFGAYATERLPKGTEVEVHQAISGGWVAIRPPEEAFDWVPAHVVEKTSDAEVARVLEEFPAFIGSNVTRAEKHLSQTSLKAGELVTILGEKQVGADTNRAETWYKIAPPSGEFRWVQAKFLTRQSPAELADAEAARLNQREEQFAAENRAEQAEKQAAKPRDREEAMSTAAIAQRVKERLAKRFPESSSATREVETRLAETEPAPRQPVEITQPRTSLATDISEKNRADPLTKKVISLNPQGYRPQLSSETEPQYRVLSKQDFERGLTNLELDLTQMVAQDASQWRPSVLRERAEELVEIGPTALERGRARLLLEKIAQFEATLPAGYEEPPTAPTKLPALALTNPSASAGQIVAESFDGRGYLMPVINAPAGTPPYQLVDRDGNTLQFVTPAPGVNLDRYVRKQVGLKGQRGYVETLQRQHLLAERVVDMERKIR